MKIRYLSLFAILLASFLFSGCFDIYYDIVQNADGTFEIRQTVGMRQDIFAQMADFMSSFNGDSTNAEAHPSAESVIDSMRRSFAHHRDSLLATGTVIGHHGITAFTSFDTTLDSMVYFTLRSTVSTIDSLPSAFHWMQTNAAMKSGAPTDSTGSDEVLLSIQRTRSASTLHFYSPNGSAGLVSTDLPGAEALFKDLHLHFRVFSRALQRPRDKHVRAIPGGQERVFGIRELSASGKPARIEASFAIRSAE